MNKITTVEDIKRNSERGLYSAAMLQPINEIDNSGPNPYRLCSPGKECGHGDHDYGGCRRTDTILEWERENSGQYLPASLDWGYGDYYFKHNGFIYYDKSFLEKVLNDDRINTEHDLNILEFTELVNQIKRVEPEVDFGQIYSKNLILSLEDIRSLITSNPNGLPRFIQETEKFFIFEDVSTEKISYDNLTPEILSKIQMMFGNPDSTYGYTCYEPLESVYLHGDNVYCLDPTSWIKLDDLFGRKYFTLGITVLTPSDIVFYPYKPVDQLTDSETTIINLFGKRFAKEYKKKLVIKNL